jgi:hypothetical protein
LIRAGRPVILPGFLAPGAEQETHTMTGEETRNLGEQPIAALMERHGLKPHDLVAASPVPMTHKMVSRACKGRRLTPNTQYKILHAFNAATGTHQRCQDLFTY